MPSRVSQSGVAHAGLRTRSGHATFQPAAAKSWESGQRPRTLQPHEMPWARAARRAPSLAPQKSLAKPTPEASNLASLDSSSSTGLDAAILAEEEARAEEEVERAKAAAQQTEIKAAVSTLLLLMLAKQSERCL